MKEAERTPKPEFTLFDDFIVCEHSSFGDGYFCTEDVLNALQKQLSEVERERNDLKAEVDRLNSDGPYQTLANIADTLRSRGVNSGPPIDERVIKLAHMYEKAEVEKLEIVRGNFGQICSYCGDNKERSWDELQEHIRVCPKHPLAEALRQLSEVEREMDRYKDVATRQAAILQGMDCGCPCCERTDEEKQKRVRAEAEKEAIWQRVEDEAGRAFDAGMAFATGGHKTMTQTHPSKQEYITALHEKG